MKEQDLHKLIRENSSNDNKVLADALKKKHPEIMLNPDVSNDSPSKKSIAKRIAIFAPLATAAALAVILIPTLLLNTNDANDGGDLGQFKNKYITENLNCTIREYNDLNDTVFLYFEWADTSDNSIIKYSHNNTKEFWGLSVSLNDIETDNRIEYTICTDDSPLDFLEYNISICTKETTVSACSVKWTSLNNNSYGIFNYDSYDYYVTLENDNEVRLFELIDILLSTKE